MNSYVYDENNTWNIRLGSAIVYQAVREFKAYLYLLQTSEPYSSKTKNYMDEIRDIIMFFKSSWYVSLCSISQYAVCRHIIDILKKKKPKLLRHEEFVDEMIDYAKEVQYDR